MLIDQNVTVQVYIYLEGTNILKTTNTSSAALQKGNSANLTIDNAASNSTGNTGSLTAAAAADSANGAGIGGGKGSNITISGGSVNAQIHGCTPVKSENENISVYRCNISNQNILDVLIDGKKWTPSIHSNDDKNLYAWLTGEDHIITVGGEIKGYIFDSSSNSFSEATSAENKHNVTSNLFTFTPPQSLTYDEMSKNATIECKSNVWGMGNIHLEYFDSNGTKLNSTPVKAGTYTVKITVDEGILYKKTTDYLTDDDWKFKISCTHKNTVNRYYSSASCTSSGYSGDTYCADCGELLSSGYTISAYGHSYDDGVITTEPTADVQPILCYKEI